MPLNPALGAEDRARLRERLLARQRELREEVHQAFHGENGATAHLPNRHREVDDEAVADAETLIDVASVERDAHELSEVVAALQRLEHDHYGLCEDCGQPIAPARLFAMPQARRCIDCERGAAEGRKA